MPQLRESKTVPIDAIVPDEGNRKIDEADEEFCSLVDSVRVLGLLSPIHVQALGDRYQIIDGERRWRACRRAGLAEVACEVWPASANLRETLVAGVVLNEQRQAHRCIHVARRLRELKMAGGLTGEQVAARTGITLDRVKTYLCLFGGSEFLLEFFEANDVPVRVAAEMIRYEKSTNEARARKLAARYLATPLGVADIQRLRKRDTADGDTAEHPVGASRSRSSVASLERAWRRDPAAALAELEALLHGLGYGVVALDETVARSNDVSSRSSGGR
jgi:ParB family chromosome partitioning protein